MVSDVAGLMVKPPVDDMFALIFRVSAVSVIAESEVSVVVMGSVMLSARPVDEQTNELEPSRE